MEENIKEILKLEPDQDKAITMIANLAKSINNANIIQMLQFTDWVGFNYIRLQKIWIAKAGDNKQHFTTNDLFGIWLKNR